jgi:cytidylate kinase
MNLPSTIAIDGPAASGKSTLAERLAKELNYLYLDTGAMYRALTLAVQNHGIDVDDENAVSILASEVNIDLKPASVEDGRQYDVLLDGEDVTWAIRSPVIDQNVSIVSLYPIARKELSEKQRVVGARGKVVMAGRDIGTIVMPDADLKIYLEASPEARAERRFKELVQRGDDVRYDQVLESIKRRDQLDSHRVHAPLEIAEDAVVIDSSAMSLEEVVSRALALIHSNKAG